MADGMGMNFLKRGGSSRSCARNEERGHGSSAERHPNTFHRDDIMTKTQTPGSTRMRLLQLFYAQDHMRRINISLGRPRDPYSLGKMHVSRL